MVKVPYATLANDALLSLKGAKDENQRAVASCRLVELGAIYNGTSPIGATFVNPIPAIHKLCGHTVTPIAFGVPEPPLWNRPKRDGSGMER